MTRRLLSFTMAAVVPVALCIAWWLASEHSKSTFYPPLSEIVSTFRKEWLFANFTTDFLPSLYRISLGFTCSVVIGVGIGLLVGSSHGIRATVEPTLDFIRAIPATAILPLAVVLFGPSTLQKVSVITFGSVWAILLNTIDGVDGIDAAFHDVSRVYGYRRRDHLFRVVLPAATPQIFAGMRIALSTSILLVVYSEMFASTNGVGYYVLNAQTLFEIPQMWSGIFVSGDHCGGGEQRVCGSGAPHALLASRMEGVATRGGHRGESAEEVTVVDARLQPGRRQLIACLINVWPQHRDAHFIYQRAGVTDMKRSSDRILVTHSGSLPRPDDLLEMYAEQDAPSELADRLPQAVEQVVRQQVELGIDIVNDGEYSKPTGARRPLYGHMTWLWYVHNRLAGFEWVQSEVKKVASKDRERFDRFYENSPIARDAAVWTCTGPISYIGQEAVRTDIDNMKAAVAGQEVEDVFVAVASPTSVQSLLVNRHYASDEEYGWAVAEAMREEYRALADAGFIIQVDDPVLAADWDGAAAGHDDGGISQGGGFAHRNAQLRT